MNARQPITVLVLTAACSVAMAAGAGWPQWRGPGRSGAVADSPALVASLPADGPALQWEYALPPASKKTPYRGSPVVADGKVYLRMAAPVADDAKARTDVLVCVSLADGSEVWKFETPGGSSKLGAPNTPCVTDGKVYSVGSQGTAFCLDAATGKEVWKTPVAKKGTFSGSIAVADGKVIVADAKLTALNAKTGEKVWENADIRALHNSPALWRHGGKTYVVCGQGNQKNRELWKTFCVDATNGGEALWSVAGGINASPVVSGDTLVVLYWETGLKVYKMTPAKATEIGAAKLASDDNQSCTPTVADGKVYGFVAKEGFCWDIAKKDFAWRIPVGAKGCSPIVADGKVIQFAGSSLQMFDAATGKQLGPKKGVKLGIVGHSSPAMSDGRLVVNAGTHLRCYDLRAK